MEQSKHLVGKYIYDANRLIFYPDGYDSVAIGKICTNIEPNDHYESLHDKLNAYNADRVLGRPGALSKAGICLTDNCNFRCNYCSASSVEGNDEPLTVEDIMVFTVDVMKRWTINKLLGKAEEPLSLNFTGGGEPTYDWDVFESAVVQIRQKCLEDNIPLILSITTNGLLDESKRIFITENFDSVMLSYDGIPEIQNKNRLCAQQSLTSNEVEETIRFFSKSQINLIIRTTIWQSDFCRMSEMADYIFSNFGISIEWSILPVIPTGRAMNRVRKEYEKLREFDFLSSYLEVVEYATKKYGSVNISTPVFQDMVDGFFCGAISFFGSSPWLLPNKTIITCIESCDVKTVIGKVEENKIIYFENFADPLLKIYQQKFEECRNCIAYRFCKGGCPVRHVMNNNVVTMDEWECGMIRDYWVYVFNNILEGKDCLGWRVVPAELDGLSEVKVLKLTKI